MLDSNVNQKPINKIVWDKGMGSSLAVETIDSATPYHTVKQYRSYLLCDAVKKVNQGVGLLQCDKEELVSVQSIMNFVPSLDLYLFKPKKNVSPQEPIFIYLPASFVGMNPDIFSVICRKMCALSQTTIAAFLYPLAPETSISEQINAVTAAYKKLFDYKNLNIDLKRVILGGYSSGSFLALHLVKKLLDQQAPLPFRLLLSFPGFDVNGKIEGNDKFPVV
ncbi:MAG: alpha/beta hydrolase, partial [Bdellovibrionales bacterium]